MHGARRGAPTAAAGDLRARPAAPRGQYRSRAGSSTSGAMAPELSNAGPGTGWNTTVPSGWTNFLPGFTWIAGTARAGIWLRGPVASALVIVEMIEQKPFEPVPVGHS